MILTSQLEITSCDRINTVNNGSVERTNQGRMNKVQEVGHGRAQTFDLECIDFLSRLNEGLRGIAAITGI